MLVTSDKRGRIRIEELSKDTRRFYHSRGETSLMITEE
jgi:hypothetical protein